MLASSAGLLILTVGVIVAFYTAVVMKTGVYQAALRKIEAPVFMQS